MQYRWHERSNAVPIARLGILDEYEYEKDVLFFIFIFLYIPARFSEFDGAPIKDLPAVLRFLPCQDISQMQH